MYVYVNIHKYDMYTYIVQYMNINKCIYILTYIYKCTYGSSSTGIYRDNRDRNQGELTISDRGPAATVATWHIPQLQLHILCAGIL
jgi:hypothetical protein